MDLKIYRDTIYSLGTVCDAQMEIPIESEILIPDYLPAVFKIVKTFVHRVILQKKLQAGRLLLEGYFRVEIMYQGEDRNLCTIEQKVAFTKQQELKSCENTAAFENYQIDISGEVQYINCRAVSQRRLDVHGAYNLYAHTMCEQNFETITALAECGIQQKNIAVPAVKILESSEKQFTLEESIEFAQLPEVILHTRGYADVQDVRIVGGKAVVKGDLKMELLYRQAESQDITSHQLLLPFNQIVDLEAADDCECQAAITPIGCSIYSDSAEENTPKVSCTCLLTVRAMKNMEYVCVADCFSTDVQTKTEHLKFTTDTLVEVVSNSVDAHTDGRLPDDSLQVVECFAECMAPEYIWENDHAVIRGKVLTHIFCRNALGEIDCYDKSCEYTLPKRYDLRQEDATVSLHAKCENIHFTQTGADANVELSVRVQGYVCSRQQVSVLQDVACIQPLEKDKEVALRVYYAQVGEDVFDIAKRYNASPIAISALAGIEGDKLPEPTRLLIPQSW